MKKLLLSSIVLFLFSASILLFQVSCKKGAVAAPAAVTTQQNKILYVKELSTTVGSVTVYYSDIWTANYDGTNAHKINITLPTGMYTGGDVKVSPDGKTIFFTGYNPISSDKSQDGFYSANIDGSNPKLIVADEPNITRDLEAAY